MSIKNKNTLLLVGNWNWDIYEEALARGFKAADWVVIPFHTNDYLPQGKLLTQLRRLRPKWTCKDLNIALLNKVKEVHPDMIIFVRCDEILPKTIDLIRTISPASYLIAYHNDNPFVGVIRRFAMRHYRASLAIVDLALVYRPSNIRNAFAEGAKHVEVLLPWFIRERHKPIPAGETNDVIYIGHFENDGREKILQVLHDAGIQLRVYGTGWEKAQSRISWLAKQKIHQVWGTEYSALLSNAKISLVFLSAKNRDVYTRRCFEIPACGSLLMAPRTKELQHLFRDGEEAVFWDTAENLASRVNYYLKNDKLRATIANAGRTRLLKDGHDEYARARQIIAWAAKLREENR
jgi:spore maturation protein CgeB